MSTDAVRAALDAHDVEDAQAAADNTAVVERLNVQLVAAQDATLAAQQATAVVQAAFDAYKASHPDPPPPPPPAAKTLFGFNIMQSYPAGAKTYFNPAGETATAMNARLVGDYGPFKAGKTFPGKVITDAVAQSAWGKYPSVVDLTLCLGWAYGSVANGSQDAELTALMKSVPAGKYVRLCLNEIDYKVTPGTSDQKNYAADMAHLVKLRDSLGLAETVGVFHCFGEWNLEQGYDYSWVNAGNCDGIIWDCYENDASKDADGAVKFGLIAAKNAELGITRWGVGEHGDRRPGSGSGAWSTDAARAAAVTARMNTLLALDVPPEVVCWFNVVGSSGDHRLLDADTATKAALAGFTRG